MKKIPVFYRPEQSSAAAVGYSPSAGKPAQVIADWTGNPDIAKCIRIESFDPLTADDIKLAHSPEYVDGVLSCKEANGFGTVDPEIAATLPYTTGSLFAAAKYAVENKTLAVSPTSGFHHANYSYGGGFCTFNGLVIAALKLRKMGLVKNVLILDFDGHYGDGTESCITATDSRRWITNITRSKHFDSTDTCMRMLNPKRMLEATFKNDMVGNPDLVIFQAGADLWTGDPLNAGLLTMEQLARRDEQIFSYANSLGVPIVFNLAGGYARDEDGGIEPVLKIHRQTINKAMEVYCG